jgi:DNA anti-recombination protein RmuC
MKFSIQLRDWSVMSLDIELKEYFDLAFRNLEKEVGNVVVLMHTLDARTQRMEIENLAAISELRANVRTALDKIGDLYQKLSLEIEARNKLEDAYDKELEEIKNHLTVRWEEQSKRNERYDAIRSIIIAVSIMVGGEIVLLIWNLIVYGGLQGFLQSLRGGS